MENILGSSVVVFIGMTVILFGCTAVMTGRALALTWQSYWLAFPYCILLGLGNRFLTFALFEGELLSVSGFIASTLVLLLLCLIAYRLTQVARVVQQYPWLFERAGPFSWREKPSQD